MLERTDAAIADLEAQQGGDDAPPPAELPADLAQHGALRQRLSEALAEVQAADTPDTVNLTDPHARVMQTRHGQRPAYNAQAVVVALDPQRAGRTGRLILATEVSTAPDDHGQLAPMIAAARVEDHPVALSVADGGYHSGAALAACAAAGYAVVMPASQTAQQRSDPYHKDHFSYDADQHTYPCPQGQVMPLRGYSHRADGRVMARYWGDPESCRSGAAFGDCTTDRRRGRTLEIGVYDQDLRQHRDWMETPLAQQLSQRRKSLLEPVFGMIKEQQRAHRLLLRGRDNADAEWTLLAVAFNLRTLARVWADRVSHGTRARGGGVQAQTAGSSSVCAPHHQTWNRAQIVHDRSPEHH